MFRASRLECPIMDRRASKMRLMHIVHIEATNAMARLKLSMLV
jgi:hypothetical protein